MNTPFDGDLEPLPADTTAIVELLADLADEIPEPRPAADPLRRSLLDAARARAEGVELPAEAELPVAARPYAAQIRALAAVVSRPDVSAVVEVVHGWDVARTLGHLLAVDSLAAEAFGMGALLTGAEPAGESAAEPDAVPAVEARTASVHRRYAHASLAAITQVWHAQAVAVLRHARAGGEDRMAEAVTYMSIPISVGDVLLDRAFETWVHAEDLREVLGLPSAAPAVAHISLLTDLGARFLSHGLETDLAEPVLLELTGPGGGSWSISSGGGRRLDPAAAELPLPRTRLALDAVEFCHVVGGRRDPLDSGYEASGDPELTHAVLVAAGQLARL
jgi:hypothetical protein